MTAHDIRRRERISKIKATFNDAKEKGIVIDKELLIAECCLEWGCTRRTVLEYMAVIIKIC